MGIDNRTRSLPLHVSDADVIQVARVRGLGHAWSQSQSKKRTFFLTVPKSGTYLLKKMLYMTIGEESIDFTSIDGDPFNPPSVSDTQYFVFNHVYPGFSVYKESTRDKCTKVILIRDPRDAIVSFCHMLRDQGWGWWTPKEVITQFQSLPEGEMLAHTILFPDEYLGLRVFFREAIEWMNDPDVFVLRFEDIVGPEGGGDRLIQENTIRALSQHLEFHMPEEQVVFIADNLFGPDGIGQTTFRKGQIGTWPQYLTENDKELFKSVMGEELLQMGYAENYDW
jgi:Sulfotransferase domain